MSDEVKTAQGGENDDIPEGTELAIKETAAAILLLLEANNLKLKGQGLDARTRMAVATSAIGTALATLVSSLELMGLLTGTARVFILDMASTAAKMAEHLVRATRASGLMVGELDPGKKPQDPTVN